MKILLLLQRVVHLHQQWNRRYFTSSNLFRHRLKQEQKLSSYLVFVYFFRKISIRLSLIHQNSTLIKCEIIVLETPENSLIVFL